MKRSMPFILVSLLAQPLLAECGCAAGPCEETTLSSVAEENPEMTGFGRELEPLASVQPHGMTLDLGRQHNPPGIDERMVAPMTVGIVFLPVVFLVRRLLSCGAPILSLGIRDREINVEKGVPDMHLVREVADKMIVSPDAEHGFGSTGGNVLPFPI